MGRSEIEGRIICKEYNVKLHIIEKHIYAGKELRLDQIVNSEGSRSVDSIDYNEENTIHIINRGNAHFEPIFNTQEIQHNKQQFPDYPNYDEVNYSEKLIKAVRNNDSEDDKIRKIKDFIDKGADINFKDANHGNNSPLHAAVRKGQVKVIELLLQEGANVNSRNAENKTPLDVAKQSNKEKIIKTLEEHLKKSSDQVKGLSVQDKEVHGKLRKFVKDFVFIYERSFSEYYARLENQTGKSGKWADFVNKATDAGKSGTEETGRKALSLIGINVLRVVISGIGVKHNREELKKLVDQLYIFKKDSVKVREELVKSGVEIFQAFESQFVQVTADGSWQRAMLKLAEDAVSRVVDYYRKNTEKEFCTSSITEGIVFEKSKKYKQTSIGTPHIKLGHTLEGKNLRLWNTEEIFDKSGLVTIKSDGSADKYYKRKDGKSNTNKYGYRLLFQSELEDKIKKLAREYSEEKPPREEYRYVLKLDEQTTKKWRSELLDEINKQDPKLVEGRLLSNFKEEMKQEAEKNFNELENFIGKNFNELSNYIESNPNEIRKVFSELMSQYQQASHKIAQSIAEGRKENKEGFEQVDKKLDEIKNMVVAGQKNKQVREQVWFNVKKPVSLFTGRKEELINLHNKIQRSRKKVTVISQITSVSGLGGIGKTELARGYIQEYSKDCYNDVIWINAESELSLIGSVK